MADANRLVALGTPPPLAEELADQIEAGGGGGGELEQEIERVSDDLDAAVLTGARFGGGLAGLEAMSFEVGYARLPYGEILISEDTTIDYPLIFGDGAYFTVAPGVTLTLRNRITSANQWIFRGDGNVILNIAGPIGEDAKDAHVSWFGVFPTNTTPTDQTAAIQRALNAFTGQTREGILDFDLGSYHVYSAMTVPRGIHLRGSGTRRTVFDVHGSGYDVFTTGGDAVKFSNFQFEQESSEVGYRDGALIRIEHTRCEVDDVWLWNSQYGIVVNGSNASLSNISATYGVDLGSGTATILVQAAGCSVDGVKVLSTGGGPEALVVVGRGAGANFGLCRVTNVQGSTAAIPVLIDADTSSVNSVNVSNVMWSGSGGTATEALVKLRTTGTAGIANVNVSGLNGNTLAGSLLKIEQGSSGVTENVTLDGSIIVGANAGGSGWSFTRTAGTLRDVLIGDTVQVAERTNPFLYSGTMSGIRVPPQITPGANNAYVYTATVPDDSVMVITPRRTIFSGSGIVTAASNVGGLLFVRVAASPNVAPLFTDSVQNVVTNSALGILTGTTGVDGDFTISTTADAIYIENRRGSSMPVNFALFSGV